MLDIVFRHIRFGSMRLSRLAAWLQLLVSLGHFRLALCQQEPSTSFVLGNPQTTVIIRSDSRVKSRHFVTLKGHVVVTFKEMMITADEATFDEVTGEVMAKGHATFQDPDASFSGDEAHYNIRTQRGWFTDASGYVHSRVRPRARLLITESPFYIKAARVNRIDPEKYEAQHARLTNCQGERAAWSIKSRKARITIDDKVVMRDSIFRLLRVPVFYSPYMNVSISHRQRQTGFLVPHIGESDQKGFIVAEGFFWAINRSANLEAGLEDYSSRGIHRIASFEATPTAHSNLVIAYDGINDRGLTKEIQGKKVTVSKASGDHLHATGQVDNFWHGFRGVLDADYLSEFAYRLTWAQTFAEAVNSQASQSGFLTKNSDADSINFSVSRFQNFLSAAQTDTVTIRETPSFSFSRLDKQVGNSPFFFSFDTSAAGVEREERGFKTPFLSERLDFHPQFLLRHRPFWGFHVTPIVGGRLTRYGTSRPETTGTTTASSGPIDRVLGEFTLDIRPPSLDRTFDRKLLGRRFRHVIEPDVQYRVVKAADPRDIDQVIRFDALDILAETNEVEYSLTNTILTRQERREGSEDAPQAHELISLRLSQKYYFDPTFGGALQPRKQVVFDPTITLTGFAFANGRRLSPVVSSLKFAPFSNFDTELRADIAPQGGVLNAGITSQIHKGPVGLGLTDFFINRTAALLILPPNGNVPQVPSFHLFQALATYVKQKGLSAAFGVNHNFALGSTPQSVGQVGYNFGCCGIGFEYRRLSLGPLRQENVFRISLSIANVGTFGTLRPRESLY